MPHPPSAWPFGHCGGGQSTGEMATLMVHASEACTQDKAFACFPAAGVFHDMEWRALHGEGGGSRCGGFHGAWCLLARTDFLHGNLPKMGIRNGAP